MIFGFNTDVKYGTTVYHVQSEARVNERLLQTQIFVRGQCIGKKAASYSHLENRPEFSETRMHEMLKAQHRATLDDLRAGRVDEALSHVTSLDELLAELSQTRVVQEEQSSMAASASAAPGAKTSNSTPELSLEFLNPHAVADGKTVVMRFRVSEQDCPTPSAKIIARLTKLGADGIEFDPVFAQDITGDNGCGEIRFELDLTSVIAGIVLVQASVNGRSTMKKFRLGSS